MNLRTLAIALLVPFTAVTAYALADVGYFGVIEQLLAAPANWQIAFDLVAALLLVLVFVFRDARARGRNPWPYLAITLVLGSFGPLLYFVLRKDRRAETGTAVGGASAA